MGFVQAGGGFWSLNPPQDITINSVTASNALIVGVGRASSASRAYNVSSNLNGAFTEVGSSTPSLANFPQYIFVLFNASAGNHVISITQVSGTAQIAHAKVIEVSNLDSLAVLPTSSFNDGANVNDHFSAQTGLIDILGPAFAVCYGYLSGTNSGIVEGSGFTPVTLDSPQREILQYRDVTVAENDQRGLWSNTGTAREGTALIVAFPYNSGGDEELTFAGSIPLPQLAVTLESESELTFSGSIPLPSLSVSISAAVELQFSGTIPLPVLSALLESESELSLAGNIPLPILSVSLNQLDSASLTFSGSIPLPTLSALLESEAELSFAGSIPLPSLQVSLVNGAADNFQAFYRLWNFRARLDVKLEIDSGNIEADEDDVSGTFVAFNKPFKDINSITVSALSITELVAIYDFVDVPNPTGFYVYVFNTSGVRVTATVSWKARGVL